MKLFDRFAKDKKEPKAKAPAKSEKATKAAEEKKAPTVPKVEPPKDSTAYRVLLRPLVSEKTARIESGSQYVFAVDTNANKVEIKKAVEHHYKVHVQKVNIVTVRGKSVRYGRTQGVRSDWRKAYVVLKKGETIAAF